MTESNPLVSIGLPTYNRVASLRRALESALAQDYPNVELVISDNASTDETEAVCTEYARGDPRVRYIRHEVNRGAAFNFETTLNEARGEFFMWLADDDWLEPNYVSQTLDWLLAHPDYVLACGRDRYYRDGVFLFEGPQVNLAQETGGERVLGYYRQVSFNGAYYGLMRRALLLAVPTRNYLGGDWIMLAQIAFAGKMKALATTALNRSFDGASADVGRMAAGLGHSKFMAANPHLLIAWNVFKDTARAARAYDALGARARLVLGARSAALVFARYCVPLWQSRARAYLRHTFDNLQQSLARAPRH